MRLYLIVGIIILIVGAGLLVSVGIGLLSAADLPFAFATLLILSAMLFLYARLRLHSD